MTGTHQICSSCIECYWKSTHRYFVSSAVCPKNLKFDFLRSEVISINTNTSGGQPEMASTLFQTVNVSPICEAVLHLCRRSTNFSNRLNIYCHCFERAGLKMQDNFVVHSTYFHLLCEKIGWKRMASQLKNNKCGSLLL